MYTIKLCPVDTLFMSLMPREEEAAAHFSDHHKWAPGFLHAIAVQSPVFRRACPF